MIGTMRLRADVGAGGAEVPVAALGFTFLVGVVTVLVGFDYTFLNGAQLSVLYILYRNPGALLVLLPVGVGCALGPPTERLVRHGLNRLDLYTLAIGLFCAGVLSLVIPAGWAFASKAEDDLSQTGILDWTVLQEDKGLSKSGWLLRLGHTLLWLFLAVGAMLQLPREKGPILGRKNN